MSPAALPTRLLLLGACLLLSGVSSAQGLGDAAGRERTRRETKPAAPAKVFTNDDLTEGASDPARADDTAESEEATPGETPELDEIGEVDPVRAELDREREERALQEREWRARFAEARAHLRAAEARCWREVVRTEFRNGIPVQMKVQEFVESEEYRQAKAALADLEEEFRRTGLPPGWARE